MLDFTRRKILISSVVFVSSLVNFKLAKAKAGDPKTVRIIVSLADNANQGIVPVPDKLGNGQDPRNNLYWGALYGIKTYFSRHKDWEKIPVKAELGGHQLDYAEFKLRDETAPIIVKAEAWDGAHMMEAITRFYTLLGDSSAPEDLVVFVGHNGLMDMFVPKPVATSSLKTQNIQRNRKAIILACKSSEYFESTLEDIGVEPYVLTRGLMAPEAYSLEAALQSWAKKGTSNDARIAAAKSYAKYQKIPDRNAKWLFSAR